MARSGFDPSDSLSPLSSDGRDDTIRQSWSSYPDRAYRTGLRRASSPRETPPRTPIRADTRIREDIRARLTTCPEARDARISVKHGDVALEGDVRSVDARSGIEDIARSVMGVKQVENRLRVAGPTLVDEERRAAADPQQTQGTAPAGARHGGAVPGR